VADWPQVGLPAPVTISPFSLNALGVDIAAAGMAAPASAALGTINLGRGYPFWVPEPILVVKLWAYNGATANGNTDVGVYSVDGRLLVSNGAAAQSGTSQLQEFNITDTVLGRGWFYMALSTSSATATFFTIGASNATYLQLLKAAGCWQATSAHALPATITFAALAAALLPVCGLSARTLVV
jgi:hypothetical protein